ncbi:hypothetical protein [Maricaulis parjimensis]|nr:hypothetical protein [Maricaulis parjimensis]
MFERRPDFVRVIAARRDEECPKALAKRLSAIRFLRFIAEYFFA